MFDTCATLANWRRKNAARNKVQDHRRAAPLRRLPEADDHCSPWIGVFHRSPLSTRPWANASALPALAPRLARRRRRPGCRWRRRRRRLRTRHGRRRRIRRCRTTRPNCRRLNNAWRRGSGRRKAVLRWTVLRRTGTPLGLSRLKHNRRWSNGLASRPAVGGRRQKRWRSGFNPSAFLTE